MICNELFIRTVEKLEQTVIAIKNTHNQPDAPITVY